MARSDVFLRRSRSTVLREVESDSDTALIVMPGRSGPV